MKQSARSTAPLARALGFRMPAEWEPHDATWIAWPHNRDDWPGRFAPIPWVYGEIVRRLAQVERVRILVFPRNPVLAGVIFGDEAGAQIYVRIPLDDRTQSIRGCGKVPALQSLQPAFVHRHGLVIRRLANRGRRRWDRD